VTLVISELSSLGIAMAADTAVTIPIRPPNRRLYHRVLRGGVKLLPVPTLPAGISYWGLGTIGGMPTDDWLRDFLSRNRRGINSLASLASLLELELRQCVRTVNLARYPNGSFGVHLAGFIRTPSGTSPAMYHVHNGPSQALPNARINPRLINANFDRPPQVYPPGVFYRTRNGDFRLYATVFTAIENLFGQLNQQGFVIPHAAALHVSPLRARAEYLRFHIKTMARIYEMSNVPVPGSIGEEVTTLTISPRKIEEYWTR
jgi:hypothetical protein